MSLFSWLRTGRPSQPAALRRAQSSTRQRTSFRPRLEALEDRWLPSTLTVTSIKDSGHGTLRAEVAAAQSGDTIVFSPTLDGQTITLTSGELDLTKNLTIQGPGAGELTISGGSSYKYRGQLYTTSLSRVFDVAQNATVTLSGLTISNGNGVASATSGSSWDGYGGGILNHGTLTASGCTVSSNSASTGGGIFSDGTLTLSSCSVSGNAAGSGGGIANSGTATLFSSAISNNVTGSGIFNHGTLTLSGCTVSGNYFLADIGCSGYLEGDGIYNDTSGTLTLENSSTVTGNGVCDVSNVGALYLDSTNTIGALDGNLAIPI